MLRCGSKLMNPFIPWIETWGIRMCLLSKHWATAEVADRSR